MYRYYPSSSLDVTFASLYELGLESETESLIPSIDEKSQPCRCFLYYVLVFNARFFTLLLPSPAIFSILVGENPFEVKLRLKLCLQQ